MPANDGVVTAHTPVQFGKPVEATQVPIMVEDDSTRMRLRQNVLSLDGSDGRVVEVSCGAGVGGDFVQMVYRHTDGEDRTGVFYLAHVAKAWIELIDHEAPQALLDALEPRAASTGQEG